MKLSKGKKLLVFFGCLRIDWDEPEKADVFSMKMEDVVKRREKRTEKVLSMRTRIAEGLNKSRDATDVSDLFSKLPEGFVFNPIMFKMHIPLSLQSPGHVRNDPSRAETEDFWVVYNGFTLMVVAICDLPKYPYGVFDVRDRIEKVFEPIIEVKGIVSPTLYATPVTFLMQDDDIPASVKRGLVTKIEKPTESHILLRELHTKISPELGRFYGTCSLRHEIDKEINEIEHDESVLLGNLLESLKTDWTQIWKKWNLINRCKRDMADILEKISKYASHRNELKRQCKNFKRFFSQRESMFTKLFDTTTFDFYAEPILSLDIDYALRVVEHVRSETEAYTLNTSTLVSALLGAVMGSVITLMLSLLL